MNLKYSSILLFVLLSNMIFSTEKDAMFEELPRDIKKLIIICLAKADSMQEAVNTIGQLVRVNKSFNQLAQDPRLKQVIAYQLIRCPSSLAEKNNCARILGIIGQKEYKRIVALTQNFVISFVLIGYYETRSLSHTKYILKQLNAFMHAGVDVNIFSSCGNTALMKAVRTENTVLVIALIKHGAPINKKNINGMTALMFAARDNQHTYILKILLDAGADKKLLDNLGRTALKFAAAYSNYDIRAAKITLLSTMPPSRTCKVCTIV